MPIIWKMETEGEPVLLRYLDTNQWVGDPRGSRLGQIMDWICLNEVWRVDLDLARLIAQKVYGSGLTREEVMRAQKDILFPEIKRLRNLGQIATAAEVSEQAEKLVDLSPQEIVKGIQEFALRE